MIIHSYPDMNVLLRYIQVAYFCIAHLTLSCGQRNSSALKIEKPLFDSLPSVQLVQPNIGEASGIADSKKNPGYLWVEEDSGNPTELFLLKHDGKVQKKITIKNIANRDWEDMVVSGTDIYIGDIGDNNAVYPEYVFYKFPEPKITEDVVDNVEIIKFRYPDGSHDAEAFLVEPLTNTIYIITKREVPSRIYRLKPPFSSSIVHVAEEVGKLSYPGVVSAAISSDRKEIIIKTYTSLGYYKIANGEAIETALQKDPIILPYQVEPQGEAVCFSSSNHGYFTLSEKASAFGVKLYFYRKK